MQVAATWCATFLILVALVALAPAVWVIGDTFTRPDVLPDAARATHAVPAWVYWSVWAGALLLAVAAYVVQLPHWSSLRIAAIVALLYATVYAALFGGTLTGGASGWAATALQVADKLPRTKGPQLNAVALWCFALLVLCTALSVWSAWRAHMAQMSARRESGEQAPM
jgi:hypothetical protein